MKIKKFEVSLCDHADRPVYLVDVEVTDSERGAYSFETYAAIKGDRILTPFYGNRNLILHVKEVSK